MFKKKIILDNLPRLNGYGGKRIDWKNSIGLNVKAIYVDSIYDIKIVDYTTKTSTLSILLEEKIHEIKTDKLLRCQLGNLLGKVTSRFKVEIGQIFKDDKRDLVITDREYRDRIDKKGNNKYYKYTCNKCGWTEGWMVESSLLKGIGCACCHNLVTVVGINDITTTAPWMVKYFQGGYDEAKRYTKSSNKRVLVKCSECGKTKEIIINNLYKQGIGCNCGDGFSKGHKYIYELFTQLKIEFMDNYKPKWCKYYNEYKRKDSSGEYDFFIEKMKLLIEIDGEFHRKDNKMNGVTKDEVEYVDKVKDILAEKNGYKVVRIIYESGEDFKKNVLNSKLNELFDLSKINWRKCEEFSLKNIVKEVCEYWNNREEWETTSDLAKTFNVDRNTIIVYLRKGVELGWCEYDAEEESRRAGKIGAKSKYKPVDVYKNNMFIKSFESIKSLSEASLEEFGVKLNAGNISAVLNNRQPHHRGYTFKYAKKGDENICME